jgi:FkbM family methyltransferase
LAHPAFRTPGAPSNPGWGEDIFEWITLLEAIAAARSRFLFVELGAGKGRWSTRAITAAHANGLDGRAILAEAEPQHRSWIEPHMQEAGITADRYTVIEAAIGASPGKEYFVVTGPHGMTAEEWYGQALATSARLRDFSPSDQYYYGKPLHVCGGWGAIEVDVRTIDSVLHGQGPVDLVDMDVQGTEFDIVEADIALLTKSVARLHIGTHSRKIDRGLKRCLSRAGWTQTWDFACGETAETDFGRITFQDGVQGWVNPNFTR